MATQLKHTDFTYTPIRPNIRVAFIAGEAVAAVHQAKLPDATLEELSIRSETEALIAVACEHLSPRMFAAFLRWAEAAVIANTRFDEDDDASADRSSKASEQLKRVAATDAHNTHDVMFKTYLMALEAADAPAIGPLKFDPAMLSGYNIEGVVVGLSDDLSFFSPVCRMIDDLSTRVWSLSDSGSAFPLALGAAMLEPIRAAQTASLPATPAGYSPYMRAPLIQWQKAYAVYEQAAADLDAFDRDVHTPAERMWARLGARVNAGEADAIAAAYDAAGAELDVAQERYDALVGARGDAIDALLSLPAPSASELAVKLRIYSDAYGWVCNDPSIGEKMTIDARRFGRQGAHLETDKALLDAYAERRQTFEGTSRSATTAADDDAYFARLDACDDTLLTTRATTLEGVVAKMRVAFLNGVGEAWSDLATGDPSEPAFVEGLRMSDMYTRLAWAAIEDLARIGGVSLAEQGR